MEKCAPNLAASRVESLEATDKNWAMDVKRTRSLFFLFLFVVVVFAAYCDALRVVLAAAIVLSNRESAGDGGVHA